MSETSESSDSSSSYYSSTSQSSTSPPGRQAIENQRVPKHGPNPGPDQQWRYDRAKGLVRFDDSFVPRAPWTSITSAEWPPKPDSGGKQVDLGPLLNTTDAKLAYRVWKLADDTLGDAWRSRSANASGDYKPSAEAEGPSLARNVYEHLLMGSAVLPIEREKASQIFEEEGLSRTWDVAGLVSEMKEEIIGASSLRGVENWTLQAIKAELKRRKLAAGGKVEIVRERLIQDELERHCGVMPLSDLSHWGVKHNATTTATTPARGKFTLQPATNTAMTPIDMYTFAIHLSPYNPTYWLSRAYCHYQQGYFDLAIGDAYRAQIICNTVEQTKDRFSKDGFYTHIQHTVERHVLADPIDENHNVWSELVTAMRQPHGIHPFISAIQKTLLSVICLSLEALNCWDDFDSVNRQLQARFNRLYMDRFVADMRKRVSKKAANAWRKKQRREGNFWFERHQGAVSAEFAYPYEQDEFLDLFNRSERNTILSKLTENVFEHPEEREEFPDVPVDICEVKVASNGQGVGVFAKRAIKRGELIHFEEPSIRGHLPPRRLNKDRTHTPTVDDTRCDNCRAEIDEHARRHSIDSERSIDTDDTDAEPECRCWKYWTRNPKDKRGVMFCPSNPESRNKSCLSIAWDLYHDAGCGRNWNWLYDTMRPNVWKWHGMEHISHSNEIHGTHLSLLLRSIVETTLIRRIEYDEPSLAPHEIDELLVLNGDGQGWRDSWFPFTMSANIIVPFDIVTFLGVNIFRDLSFDTWSLQIILRKLLANAVPWDMRRREDVPAVLRTDGYKGLENPSEQKRRLRNGYSFREWDPSFMDLYLFPGFSLFNHMCAGKQNAEWGFDRQILNRVVVWACEDVEAGEEIRIRYQYENFHSQSDALRYFGGPCLCANEDKHEGLMETDEEEDDVDDDDYGRNIVESNTSMAVNYSSSDKGSQSSDSEVEGHQAQETQKQTASTAGSSSISGEASMYLELTRQKSQYESRRSASIISKIGDSVLLHSESEEQSQEKGDDPSSSSDDSGVSISEDSSDESTQPTPRSKHIEHASIQNNRVAIRRLLTLEEEQAHRPRREFKTRKAGSLAVKKADKAFKAYRPMVDKEKKKGQMKWVALEREALRDDREKKRGRDVEDPDEDEEKRVVNVPQIARGYGVPIVLVPAARPEVVEGLNHRKRKKKDSE